MDMRVTPLEEKVEKLTLDEYRKQYQIAKKYQMDVGPQLVKLIMKTYGSRKDFAEYLSTQYKEIPQSVAKLLTSFERGNLGIFPSFNSLKSPDSYTNLVLLAYIYEALELPDTHEFVAKTKLINSHFTYTSTLTPSD